MKQMSNEKILAPFRFARGSFDGTASPMLPFGAFSWNTLRALRAPLARFAGKLLRATLPLILALLVISLVIAIRIIFQAPHLRGQIVSSLTEPAKTMEAPREYNTASR